MDNKYIIDHVYKLGCLTLTCIPCTDKWLMQREEWILWLLWSQLWDCLTTRRIQACYKCSESSLLIKEKKKPWYVWKSWLIKFITHETCIILNTVCFYIDCILYSSCRSKGTCRNDISLRSCRAYYLILSKERVWH